jgi:HSP20 family protein
MRSVTERLFDDPFFGPMFGGEHADEGTLALDISQKDGNVIVQASLPGFRKEDIDVQLHQGVLSIDARNSEETEQKAQHYYRRERRRQSLARRIALPGIVESGKVDAVLKDGILTLTVPLPEQEKPKQIEIKTS